MQIKATNTIYMEISVVLVSILKYLNIVFKNKSEEESKKRIIKA
jgi:hypothetical protein